ncbi:MAG: transposase [Pirellulaceae bacterium]|nr:transposase [Pirellulaceae bacterium]
MSKKRRSFSAAFKAKIALEAHRGLKTVGELAKQHQVHPTQIVLWKKQLQQGIEGVFERSSSKAEKSEEPLHAELNEQIGKLKMQLEWLKKKVAEHGS